MILENECPKGKWEYRKLESSIKSLEFLRKIALFYANLVEEENRKLFQHR